MNTLIFKVDDTLKSIIEHSRSHPEGQTSCGEVIKPSLLLVKDQGAYLMAPTNPRQLVGDGERCVVAYAEGCNPNVDKDFYENARALCGGDDFAEPIALEGLSTSAAIEIRIKLTDEDMTISTVLT